MPSAPAADDRRPALSWLFVASGLGMALGALIGFFLGKQRKK